MNPTKEQIAEWLHTWLEKITEPIPTLSLLEEYTEWLMSQKEPKEEPAIWVPQIGEIYWASKVGEYVQRYAQDFNWNGGALDHFNLTIGNVSKTEEGAIQWWKLQELKFELKQFAFERCRKARELDVSFSLSYDKDCGKWGVSIRTGFVFPGLPFFKSKEDGLECIKHFGSRLDLLLTETNW